MTFTASYEQAAALPCRDHREKRVLCQALHQPTFSLTKSFLCPLVTNPSGSNLGSSVFVLPFPLRWVLCLMVLARVSTDFCLAKFTLYTNGQGAQMEKNGTDAPPPPPHHPTIPQPISPLP